MGGKHFEGIAKILYIHRANNNKLIEAFSDFFASENLNFNKQKFYEVCVFGKYEWEKDKCKIQGFKVLD